jgi:plasmid stabilization system protein ParE
MIDLKLETPVPEEIEVDGETSAAIENGIKAADEGLTVPLEEVRKTIPKWISKFESQEPALEDLEQIVEYSWANFPATAERFGTAILNHLEVLGSYPYIGSPVTGHPHVRQLVHTPIVIYYRIHEERKAVEILHFWHGQRRPPGL